MQKLATLLVVTAALAAGASAQSTPIEKPLRAEFGLYIPTFDSGDPDLGFTVGLGYSFYKIKDIEFAGVLRGSFFRNSEFGADSDNVLTTLGVDARWQPLGQKYFFGIGLGAARADQDVEGIGSGDTTKFGYSAEAGYDFTEKLYGVVRYQGASIQGMRGVTVGVGYRF